MDVNKARGYKTQARLSNAKVKVLDAKALDAKTKDKALGVE